MAGFVGPDAEDAGFVGPDAETSETGALEAAGRGAANNLPLGPQVAAGVPALFGHGDYSANLEDWKSKAAQAKAEHPLAYGAGAVTGTVAPMLIPGVGEAAEAAPVLTGAAIGAAGGVSDVDLMKHPGEAVEKGAVGAGGGALMGKLASMLPDLAGRLSDKADLARIRTLGIPPKTLGNMKPEEIAEYSAFEKMHDLGNADVEGAAKRATDAQKEIGRQIKEIGADAHPAVTAPQHAMSLLDKASKLEPIEGSQRDVRTLLQGASNIEKNGKTFEQLQQLKTFYGDKAFDAAHEVKDKAAADVYGAIKQAMVDTINAAPEKYRALMNQYKIAGDAVFGLTKKLGAQRAGAHANGIGFVGRLLGQMPGQSNPLINLLTAAAVGAVGHPMMGFMAATPSMNNPAVQAKAYEALARLLPDVPRSALPAIAAKLFQEGTDEPGR